MSQGNRVAVVTGGSRGIGLAIVRGLAKEANISTLIFTSTDEEKGKEVLKSLNQEGLTNVKYHQLDVSNEQSCNKFVQDMLNEYGRVDILVNNAGVFKQWGVSSLETDFKIVHETYETNTLGPLRLCIGFIPKMRENNFGRIVNMSSGAGQLSDMNGNNVAYRLSKSGLNTITRILNDENKNYNILVNSMCPGFVKTDMTGGDNSRATKTPEQGADTAIWLATLPDEGPRGGFFRDRKSIAW